MTIWLRIALEPGRLFLFFRQKKGNKKRRR
jgi:hypothetical protein